MPAKNAFATHQFTIVLAAIQVIVLILFALFASHQNSALPAAATPSGVAAALAQTNYTDFQDVHVVVLVGLGFLVAFLRRYGFASFSLTLLLSVVAIELSILVRGLLSEEFSINGKFNLSLHGLIQADFTAAVVLISFGALIGKISPIQCLFLAIIEVPVSILTEHLIVRKLGVQDIGGSLIVHLFGAVFGLAASKILFKKSWPVSEHQGSVYHSEVFSFVGVAFLWVFWPSFNAVNAYGADARNRSIINTYIALVASTVVAFLLSQILNKNRHFNIRHIASASLAGGVALGATANLILVPVHAFIIGSVAGVLSIVGFQIVNPKLALKLNLHDTRGVLSLHAIPGIVGGLASVILFLLNPVYPEVSRILAPNQDMVGQALMQLAGLAIAIVIPAIAGVVTGLILKLKVWNQVRDNDLFSDADYFDVPEDYDFTTKVISHIERVELSNVPERHALLPLSSPTGQTVTTTTHHTDTSTPGTTINVETVESHTVSEAHS